LSKGNKHPFGDKSNERIVQMIRKEPTVMVKDDLKEAYSRDGAVAFELIQSMLEMEPAKRPTVAEILKKSTLFLFNLAICMLLFFYPIDANILI